MIDWIVVVQIVIATMISGAVYGIIKMYDLIRSQNGAIGKLAERISAHQANDTIRLDTMDDRIKELREEIMELRKKTTGLS